MRYIIGGILLVLIGSCSFDVSSASNRDSLEINMAEDAIFWSLIASSGERNRNECARNSFACSDDRADLGLALLGSKVSIQANEALMSLLRYQLDGGVASNFNCFVLSKKSMARKILARIKSSALRNRCLAERARVIANHPEFMSDADPHAICADIEEIEAKRRRLLVHLNRGEICPSNDF